MYTPNFAVSGRGFCSEESNYGFTSKKSPKRRFTLKIQPFMPRMEKFNDGKAFSQLKFLYASNVVVNSKIELNTVVYDIAFSYLFFAETFYLY